MRRLLVAVVIVATACVLEAATSSVRGRITDADGLALPGVVVTLEPLVTGPTATGVTDQTGAYTVDAPPGRYRLTAELSGFSTATRPDVLLGRDPIVVDLSLAVASFEERVTVSAAPAVPMMGSPAPDAPVTVTREVIDSAMLPNSQYDDVLPLMPNVVRGPDGLISVAGARASQGALIINGFNQTDPITGAPGLMLPIEAVDAVQVYSGGYTAAYGRATGGVTSVVTHAGADHLHVSANSFFPRVLFADGGIHGVEFWEPNAGVSGPLVKGRAYFEEAVSYRYDRNRYGTLVGTQESKFTALLSWSQVDLQLSPRQHAAFTVSVDPQRTDRANITAFSPADAVPSLAQGGWSGALADRMTIGDASSLELRVSVIHTGLTIEPNGTAPYAIGHDLTRGTYYDRQTLHGQRTEGTAAYSLTGAHGHLVTLGVSVDHAALDGADASAPVSLLRSDGSTSRTITFAPPTAIAASSDEFGAFVSDTWMAAAWLTLDTGVRFDRASPASRATVTPRLAWTIKPSHGGTSLSGSVGLYADKLILGAFAFPMFPSRSVQAFDAAGAPLGAPATFRNMLNGPLDVPRAVRWDVGLDQHFDAGWLARVKYQERYGRDELVVAPDATGGLALTSTGSSTARSLETTLGYRAPTARHEIYVSYVRAAARGDLNGFDATQGIFKEPFVQANAVGPLPMDVPNRLLAWGLVHLPARITVAPFAEARNGFPYSAIDENWLFAGARNGGRLPWVGSLDFYVNKIVGLPGHLPDARIGLKIYGMVSANTARDVQRDVARADFGATYNPVPRDFSMVFELLWGRR